MPSSGVRVLDCVSELDLVAVWIHDDCLRSVLRAHGPAGVANPFQCASKITNHEAQANVGGIPTASWIELQDYPTQRARVMLRSSAVLLWRELGSEGAEECSRCFEVSTTEHDQAEGLHRDRVVSPEHPNGAISLVNTVSSCASRRFDVGPRALVGVAGRIVGSGGAPTNIPREAGLRHRPDPRDE